jgi:hypothetical protein
MLGAPGHVAGRRGQGFARRGVRAPRRSRCRTPRQLRSSGAAAAASSAGLPAQRIGSGPSMRPSAAAGRRRGAAPWPAAPPGRARRRSTRRSRCRRHRAPAWPGPRGVAGSRARAWSGQCGAPATALVSETAGLQAPNTARGATRRAGLRCYSRRRRTQTVLPVPLQRLFAARRVANPPTGEAGTRKVDQPIGALETGAKGERR